MVGRAAAEKAAEEAARSEGIRIKDNGAKIAEATAKVCIHTRPSF